MLPSEDNFRGNPVSGRRSNMRHQLVPLTLQGRLETDERGAEDVQLAGLDLLDRPWIETDQFSQPFLGELPLDPKAPDVGSQTLELS